MVAAAWAPSRRGTQPASSCWALRAATTTNSKGLTSTGRMTIGSSRQAMVRNPLERGRLRTAERTLARDHALSRRDCGGSHRHVGLIPGTGQASDVIHQVAERLRFVEQMRGVALNQRLLVVGHRA